MDIKKIIDKAELYFQQTKNFQRAVILLMILFVIIRCFHLNSPILDRHSWNQTSAAAVAMNIYKNPATLLKPDSNVFQTEIEDSTLGQEFPVFMGLIALGYKILGPEIWVARIIAISLALVGWIFLLRLLLLKENNFTALFVLFLYTINSHNWFFDRAIHSDTGMVSFMLAALFYFLKFIEEDSLKNTLLLFSTTLLAGLFKPYGLQIGISFIAILILRKEVRKLFNLKLLSVGLLVWVANLSWLLYTQYYLVSAISIGHDLGFAIKELFTIEFLYVMVQRLFDQITTQFLMFFCIFAIFSRKIKNDIFLALLLGNIFYVILITHGNLVHNYYQLPFTPALIVFSGLGFLYWARLTPSTLSRNIKAALVIFLLIGYSGYSGKKTWNHFRLSLGPKILGDQIKAMDLPQNTRLLTLENSGTRYHETLYYADKKGWVERQVSTERLDHFRQKGVEYVTLHYEESYFNNGKIMAPINQMLTPLWISKNCKNTYGDPCLLGIYKFKQE